MFETLKPQAEDKILMLMRLFREDPRQDKIDLRAYGLTAASIGTSVVVDLVSSPGDTVIHIGGDSIKLAGVSGTGTSAVTADDFLFA